ncbi:MAG: PDDEXK nuclease domain-containing protein [Bacteroidales bacterium]|nr:PDDEXK nuclease domain-containing protein [Bacteroidales bacterium]
MESSKEKYMKENKNADKPSFVYRDGMTADTEYVEWLSDLKRRYKQSQLRTAVKANSEVLEYYWNLGRDIVAKEAESKWGSGFFNQLSLDMRAMFPDEKGFSSANLRYMKRWYEFYYQRIANLQQPVEEFEKVSLQQPGQGFAYLGRQKELRIDEENVFFPDLLFYHIPQRRYVIVELKAVKFMPEFAGKLNFYVTAADKLLRSKDDNPSVGLLICKTAKKTIVEWSLQDIQKPLGVASYQLQEVVERTIAELENKKKV